jgi:hypothetical protein
MQLSALSLEDLEIVEYRSKQVERIVSEGKPRPRTIYRCENYYYKIWTSDYKDHRTVFWRGKRRLARNIDVSGNEVLLGFLYGLYDESICPAFTEHIYDGTKLVGYKVRAGEVLPSLSMDEPDHRAFTQHLTKLSLASGFVHRDLKARNMIRLPDGRLSLIDLECPLTMLAGISIEREMRDGCLARYTFKGYQEFVREFLNPDTKSHAIQRAQRRFSKGPPEHFRLAIDDG